VEVDSRRSIHGGDFGVTVLQGVRRFASWVVGATLLATALGWGASQLQPPRYEATAEMLLVNPLNVGVFGEIGPRDVDASRYLQNQAQRLESSTVAARAAEQFEGDLTAAEVRERIAATASTEADLLGVTASAATAEEAAALANAVVEAYQEIVAADMQELMNRSIAELEKAQGDIQARIDTAQAVVDEFPANEFAKRELDAAVNELIANEQLTERIAVDASLYGSGVEMVEPAVPPESPVAPRTTQNTMLAALLGLSGAAALAVWRSRMSRRADHRLDPGEVLHAPLLGAVPDLGSLSGLAEHCPTVAEPDTSVAEAYRFVATALEHELKGGVRSVVVTSALPREGKTTVALNLAAALEQGARPTLLVDADVRQRTLSMLTLTNGRPGLADVGDRLVDDVVHRWGQEWSRMTLQPADRTSLQGLPPRLIQVIRALPPVVPVGVRAVDPTQFFRTNRYRAALQRLNEQRLNDHERLSVIDAPPLLSVSDASAIAGSADGIVLVVNRGTPLHVLTSLRERLAFVGTPVLGYVFNRVEAKRGGYYGYSQASRPPVTTAEPSGVQAPGGAGAAEDNDDMSEWFPSVSSQPLAADNGDVRGASERR
jgi:Mrp family chromosome partitioning ATPase/capsular polysaccharide biosynthesis protein